MFKDNIDYTESMNILMNIMSFMDYKDLNQWTYWWISCQSWTIKTYYGAWTALLNIKPNIKNIVIRNHSTLNSS